MKPVTDNTPLETHLIDGVPILVKREDLCCPDPGPSFSKIRGCYAHIQKQESGVIGVLDTFHSKAGWAVSFVCQQLGKKAVNFWPLYKADDLSKGLPREQQQRALALGAEMIPLKAGRSAILYHAARKVLAERYPGGYLMPNALKLPESVTENAAEVLRTPLPDRGTMVISISSGTIAAGVLNGMSEKGILDGYSVILHMGYSRSTEACFRYMERAAKVDLGGRLRFVNEGFGYKDAVEDHGAPFPCNPHYDGKAWAWLRNNAALLQDPIVFWNIGE